MKIARLVRTEFAGFSVNLFGSILVEAVFYYSAELSPQVPFIFAVSFRTDLNIGERNSSMRSLQTLRFS